LTSSDSDNYGNKYDKGLFHSFQWGTRWICRDYAVDGKYDTLSGIIALSNSTKNTNSRVVFIVEGKTSGEFEELYKSPVISSGKRPVEFAVNISGYSNIRIIAWACDSNGNTQDSNGKSYSVSDNFALIIGNPALN
jgi:hypothetical protein